MIVNLRCLRQIGTEASTATEGQQERHDASMEGHARYISPIHHTHHTGTNGSPTSDDLLVFVTVLMRGG